MNQRNPQLSLLKNQPKSYGGELLKTRKARSCGRPLDTRNTMHLVLRSTKARGGWSFKSRRNEMKIGQIITRFSSKYGIRVMSLANVGNHLHLQIKLSNRYGYFPFIRAITSSIAMAVTGTSRWKRLKQKPGDRFWDYRPFTRVVHSFKAILNLRDYIRINEMEGYGYHRDEARFILRQGKLGYATIDSG